MYMEASHPHRTGQTARLLGLSNGPTSASCLKFYYHMYGSSDMGTLNVYIQTGTSLGSPIWTQTGNQGEDWILARITVTSESNWQVRYKYEPQCEKRTL